jgi:hypothetical protein
MKRSLLSFATLIATVAVLGQAQIVMNNAAGPVYMVFNNNGGANAPGVGRQTWLVIDHGNANGLVLNTPALAGGVRSENEYNMIRWRTAGTIASYTVPFNSPLPGPNGTNIPLTFNKTTAGVGAGSTIFATYNYGSAGAAWDNYTYRPSDVTHCSDDPTNTSFNSGSPFAVDRFWIIDTKAAGHAYTTNPDATLSFTNVDAEITAGNAITAAATDLDAQRFNFTNLHWGDYFPGGNWAVGALAGTHVVSGVNMSGAQFYRSWTLASSASPLPVELTTFSGNCVNSRIELKWSTATETNNSYFEIEKSMDGTVWSVIGTVNGAGTSLETVNYSFVDAENTGSVAYYRLRQVDNNGEGTYSTAITAGCDVVNGTELVNVWDNGINVELMVSSTVDGVYDITLLDAHSKTMSTLRNQQITKGITYLSIPKGGIATGVYMVRMHNQAEQFSRKVVLN